jgi:hypothetical protein
LKMLNNSGFHKIPALAIRNVWRCGLRALDLRLDSRQVQAGTSCTDWGWTG